MNMPDIPPEASKFSAGFVGSLVSLRWLPGTVLQRIQMLAAGTAVSWFAADPIAKWSGMNAGTAGFFLGVFGMAVVDKIFTAISTSPLAATFNEWLRKTIGLPPSPPKE